MRSFSFISWLFLLCIASTLLIAEPGDQLINKVNKTLSTSGSPTNITGGLVNTGSWIKFTIVFILVLISIYVLFLLIKRLKFVPTSNSLIKVIQSTPIGKNEFVVLAQMGKVFFLLGVSPNSVSLLDKIDGGEQADYIRLELSKTTTNPANFLNTLRKKIGKGKRSNLNSEINRLRQIR